MMKTFEQWFNSASLTEIEEAIPVAKSPTSIESDSVITIDSPDIKNDQSSDDGHSKLMKDCDDIITSLQALSDHIDEGEEVNESNPMTATIMADPIIMGAIIGLTAITGAVIGTTKAAVDAKRNKKISKEVDKDYDKLKGISMQELKVEFAVTELEKRKKELRSGGSMEEAEAPTKPSKKDVDSKKKEALKKMKAKLDIQIDNLKGKQINLKDATSEFRTGLDVKYGKEKVYGFFSGKVKTLIAQKKDEILQTETEYKLKNLGDTMDPSVKKDLNERLQKAKAAQKKRLTQLKEEQRKEAEKLATAKKEDPAVAKEWEENKDKLEPKKEETEEVEPKEEPKEEPTDKSDEKEDEKEDDFDAFGDTDKTDNSKDGMTKRIDAVIAKAEESGDESKVKKAKELKSKILAKESWQLGNTKLGSIFESDLRKMEMSFMLNEFHQIKERFSKLI